MERSEVLEALYTLNVFMREVENAANTVGVMNEDVTSSIEVLNEAHNYDPAENWWEQV